LAARPFSWLFSARFFGSLLDAAPAAFFDAVAAATGRRADFGCARATPLASASVQAHATIVIRARSSAVRGTLTPDERPRIRRNGQDFVGARPPW
jgi:hypothetical protein